MSTVPVVIRETAADQIGELRRGFKAMVDELAANKAEVKRLGDLLAA